MRYRHEEAKHLPKVTKENRDLNLGLLGLTGEQVDSISIHGRATMTQALHSVP